MQRFATALGIAMLRLFGLLPAAVVLKSWRFFRFLLYRLGKKVWHVSRVNIELCFPDWSDAARQKLLEQSIEELAHAIAETLWVWFKDARRALHGTCEVENPQYWQSALKQSRGVILLSCHSGSLDLNVALLNQLPRDDREFAFTYRQPSNRQLDRFLCERRQPYADYFFPVGNLMGISRVLKKGGMVWYAPDIETSKKGREFVQFMGVEAATSVAIARLAESSGAMILPYTHKRLAGGKFSIKFFAPLELNAEVSVAARTQQVNDMIASMVRENPAAYWWSIKRFRYRSDGSPSPY